MTVTTRRMFTRVLTTVSISAFVLGAAPSRVVAQQGPTAVILVRHAEKAAVGGNDPALSDIGTARAEALATALVASPPTAIITTTLQRTSLTAAAVAKKTGVAVKAIPVTGGDAHATAVANAVRESKGVVLVVGHSNTVPAIIKALGGPALPDICDASYSYLFVLTPARDGAPVSLVISHYGAAEPAPPATCAGMVPK